MDGGVHIRPYRIHPILIIVASGLVLMFSLVVFHCTVTWNVIVENWLSRTMGVLCYEVSAYGCSWSDEAHKSQLPSFSQTVTRQQARNKFHPWLPTVTSLILDLLQSPLLKLTRDTLSGQEAETKALCNQRQNSLFVVRAPRGEQKILWLNWWARCCPVIQYVAALCGADTVSSRRSKSSVWHDYVGGFVLQ